jgi:hypothetical protein
VIKAWLPKAMKATPARVVGTLYSFVLGGLSDRASTRRFNLLYRDSTLLARSHDLNELRRAFDRDLSMRIGEAASERIFVHAGVVVFETGAVVVPGRSTSGKTTLIQALVREGGVYYSDEYALLDSRGWVSPWAEPLSIRRNGPLQVGERHSAASLGLVVGRRAVPVRMIVLTSFARGGRFKPVALSPAAGVLGLLEHTLPARTRPRAALRALALAAAGARVIRSPRGEARYAARAIVRALDRPPGSESPGSGDSREPSFRYGSPLETSAS